jgi:hypothetical protein
LFEEGFFCIDKSKIFSPTTCLFSVRLSLLVKSNAIVIEVNFYYYLYIVLKISTIFLLGVSVKNLTLYAHHVKVRNLPENAQQIDTDVIGWNIIKWQEGGYNYELCIESYTGEYEITYHRVICHRAKGSSNKEFVCSIDIFISYSKRNTGYHRIPGSEKVKVHIL